MAPAAAESVDADRVFAEAQRAYHQKDYDTALGHLRAFLKTARPGDPKRFGVIEQVARIHLQYKRDAKAAIAFLQSTKKTTKLSKEDADDIKQWIATAREWQKMGALEGETESADKLFTLGKKFYRQGVTTDDDQGDEAGAASRYIAASYLVPFVVSYDSDPRLAKVLLMLGDIRRRSWKDEDWWTVEFYLKEAIRRFPRTPEAKRAYALLEQDIRMRWSGATGDTTPRYLKEMLARYKALAHGSGAGQTQP